MVEFPKMVRDSFSLSKTKFGDMGVQKIATSDQYEGSLGKTDISDSFIVDIDNMSPSTIKDSHSVNPRISVMLHRNLSRNESTLSASSRTRDGSSTGTGGGCDPDMSTPAPVACVELKEFNEQPQQTITTTAENRNNGRMHSKQHVSFINPRRVLFLFATLSSMGTIILIYFTLSIRKLSGDADT